MDAIDAFNVANAEFMQDRYDCVDRIILNAYFQMGCSPGGFRTWWRALYGTDENLDNNHLMRLAGRFARRVRGWAKSENIPLIDCAAGERKHDLAEQYLPKDRSKTGIFLVLVNRAPFPVWDVRRFGEGGIDLRRKKPAPYVNHYTFHIWDEQWGHVAIRMCGHPPFSALVMLNGHEYVTSGCQQQEIPFRKEGNCFTELADAPGLQHVADTLRSQDATGRLRQVCERWLYRCLCFALDSDEQKRTQFRYELSMFQLEYSRNFLFNRGRELEQIFQGLIDRTRATLDIKTVKTILGCKQRPQKRGKTRWEITVETPEYGLTIFKVHAGTLSLKMYTKGERVLRCEIMLHNARVLKLGTSLERWPAVTGHLQGVLERFLEVIECADAAKHMVRLRFGENVAAPDPSDTEAMKRFQSTGGTIVVGLSKGEWANVKRSGGVLPAGQICPTAKPYSSDPNAKPVDLVAEENWTEGMKTMASYARFLAEELLGVKLVVSVVRTTNNFVACYGSGRLDLNLFRLGHKWFDGGITEEVDRLLIHEFGHEFSSDHLSEDYHEALCRLGAKLKSLAVTKPEALRRF